MTFEEAMKMVVEKATVYWGTYRVETLVNDLQETYAPKIKMTFEQKDELMQFLGESDFGFENFWICLGSGANLYNEFTENELMRAWLHPELIEVTDE